MKRLALLAALAVPLSACAAGEHRAVRRGAISVGMSMDQVSEIWGPPANVVRATSELGEDVQWIYSDGRLADFDGGAVKSFEDPASPPK
ncbi:MAG TPA: hypothetical protein VN915_03190 [Elusimicrobiota bacterium]|nr:hypothetical protein [Elusimicrobiota bacterium]